MARSRRHSPVSGTAGSSNKEWKKKANRKLRHAVKDAIRKNRETMPVIDEVANLYDSPKDGTTSWWHYPPHLWYIPQDEWKVMMK